MTIRLAYLRGNGIEMAVHVDRLKDMGKFACDNGLRRLMPVQSEVPDPERPNSSNDVWLLCSRCGGHGQPHQMLVNIDGMAFGSYEHVSCP